MQEVVVSSASTQQPQNDRVPATNIPGGISFGPNANRGVVSQYTINMLSDIMRQSNNPNIVITSTLRTPEDQARAMYNNIVSRGVQYNLNLYSANGDRVVNVAAQGRRQGLTRDEIIAAMAREIRRIGPGRVSRHAGDPNVINVLDISPHSIRNRQDFVREIRERNIFDSATGGSGIPFRNKTIILKMKNILFVVSLYAFLISCNDTNSASESQIINDSVNTKRQSVVADTSNVVIKDTIKRSQPKSDLANNILGTWALVGMENASFVIEKKKITYPETFTSYKYSLVNDSIKIKYDDYTGSYLIKMNGSDTLILVGDEQQIFYRFKN